jgi:hypothetical protein
VFGSTPAERVFLEVVMARICRAAAAAALTLALASGAAMAADKHGNGKGKGHAKHGAAQVEKHGRGHDDGDRHARGRDDRRDEDTRAVGTTGQRFRGMDRNHDGVISRAEWRGNDRSFAVHDTNHDGVLSGDEVRAGSGTVGASPSGSDPDEVIFARLDANRDGVLSRGEWNGSDADFTRLDFDHNGVLSPYEFGVGR